MLLTVATVEDLERRVVALETAQHTKASTLRWIAGTLVQIQATVDDHTLRFDKIDFRFDKMLNLTKVTRGSTRSKRASTASS